MTVYYPFSSPLIRIDPYFGQIVSSILDHLWPCGGFLHMGRGSAPPSPILLCYRTRKAPNDRFYLNGTGAPSPFFCKVFRVCCTTKNTWTGPSNQGGFRVSHTVHSRFKVCYSRSCLNLAKNPQSRVNFEVRTSNKHYNGDHGQSYD